MINAVIFMQQYFVNTLAQPGETIAMTSEQAHHIRRVMRMQQGDVIRVADNSGQIMLAEVEFQKDGVQAHILKKLCDHSKTSVELVLAQGMIKGEKWDYLLQKSAELGAAEIIPFVSSRCVVKIKDDKTEKKTARWNKILCEACEQCKRSTLVQLKEPCAFSDLKEIPADLRLIAYEDADQCSERLCDVLRAHPSIRRVLMVVGSEGGFSAEEVAELVSCGFHRVSLGGRILRAETAALSLLNSIEFYYDMAGEK